MTRQKKHLEKDLQDIYKEAPIGLCFLDTNLRYIHINDWLAAINGLSVEAHLGRALHEVLPEVAASVEHQLREVMETGEPLFDGRVETETPAHPGVVRTFQHSYYPNRSKDGRIVGVSCVVADITVRKLAEEELADSQQQLRQLLEDRERLNQDLHDGILQSLYAVRFTLETSNLAGHKTPRQAARKVDHCI